MAIFASAPILIFPGTGLRLTGLRFSFSSDHGLFSWTPLLALALLGFVFVPRSSKILSLYFPLAAAGFYYLISSYPYWDGMASFGNRFFISLTPIYIFGLAALLQRCASWFSSPRLALLISSTVLACFIVWNLGFIYQWGAHLIPARGSISFREVAYNQFYVVPEKLTGHLAYLSVSPQTAHATDRAEGYRTVETECRALDFLAKLN